MEDNHITGDTVPTLAFTSLIRELGQQAVGQMLAAANIAWDAGEQGVIFEDEQLGDWAVTFDPDYDVTFRFHRWGPYTLSVDVVREIIDTFPDASSA